MCNRGRLLSVRHCLVSLLCRCIVQRLSVTDFMHPCIEPLCIHARHPCRGYFAGATAPSPCRGLRPKARMLWLLAKSFARCKTNRASNKRHPIFNIYKRFFYSLIRTAKAVRTYIYISVSCPSTDMIATCHGMNLPLFCKAVLTAFSMPAQHGTSILTTVTLFISLFLIISVSFSV